MPTQGFTINSITADVLIIGAGGAGARAAIAAAQTGLDVVLVSRSPLGKGGLTPTANGGYHAALVPGDSPELHAADLIAMGCRLNDRPLVGALTREALEQARELERFGARINWDIPPKPHEPRMRYPRSLFVPGKEVMDALRRELRKFSNVRLLEDCLALQLLTSEQEVAGAALFNIREGAVTVCRSKATVLATGSLGEIYPLSAQTPMGIPTGSTGSGYVLSGTAGADLVDMEMVQFAVVPAGPPLIRETRCLPWAPLQNCDGREFLPPGLGEYSHEAAQAIYQELRRGKVIMDLRDRNPAGHVRHPSVASRNKHRRECGVTPYQRPVEVGLGALFVMGGVHINERCETTAPGLFACGEVAGNVHGARRCGGNAFPEMIVFGARAGKAAAEAAGGKRHAPDLQQGQIEQVLADLAAIFRDRKGPIAAGEVRRRTQAVMGRHGHVFRNRAGLESALEELQTIERDLPSVTVTTPRSLPYNLPLLDALDVRWLVAAAQIVCTAALYREESRGFHFREDFPQEKEGWLKHTLVRRAGEEWRGGEKPVVM